MTFPCKCRFVKLATEDSGDPVAVFRPIDARHLVQTHTFPESLTDFFKSLAEDTVVEIEIYKAADGAPTAMGVASAKIA